MKRKDDPSWVSPQGILRALNQRPMRLATREENAAHREAINSFGTPESRSHQKVSMFRATHRNTNVIETGQSDVRPLREDK